MLSQQRHKLLDLNLSRLVPVFTQVILSFLTRSSPCSPCLKSGEPTAGTGQVDQPAVEAMLATLRNSSWEQVSPVGDSEEYRVKAENGAQASALAFGDSLVHGSLLTRA